MMYGQCDKLSNLKMIAEVKKTAFANKFSRFDVVSLKVDADLQIYSFF